MLRVATPGRERSRLTPHGSPGGPAPDAGFDVLDLPVLGRLGRWRHVRTALQAPLLALAVVVVWDGLTGPQLAPKNLATVLVWLHLRGLTVLALLAAGNLLCMACPFMLPRSLARRVLRPRRAWPRLLRGKVLAAALFAAFLFAYEYFDLWAAPAQTAWLILGFLAAALVVDGLWRGAPFCKHVCPLGQLNMVGSLVSPLEVRVRSTGVCETCRTKDCISGRGARRGCELGLFQQRKVGNMDCTFCLDCVHACPHGNVGVLARLPASELWGDPRRSGLGRFSQRPDLAVLVALVTFGALLNAFAMISPAYTLEKWLAGVLHVRAELPVLAILFAAGLLVVPAGLLAAAGGLSRWLAGTGASLRDVATGYAYALVPLGFGIWLAHYSFHFLTGLWTVVPVVQSLLAELGSPLLGAPRWDLGPAVPAYWLAPMETGFIGLGWLGSTLAALQIARREAPERPLRAAVPWAALVLLLAAAALWVMAQPMEMRGTALAG